MSDHASGGAIKTYLNPVYPKSFPDPFVLKHDGRFYCYSTGFAEDGNVFGVITSNDLVNWTELGGAMKPLETSPPYYWAPEVTYSNGKFYLYYSVGNETLMEIRVAVSDRPDSGFIDSCHRLTYEDFAIDAHVFIDDDGSKYLFYATDFLEHSHIGTGTVVDRMIDWFTLAGEPHPVTRAKYDWQVYDPNRKEKGGVRWHTVEGPTVMKRKGTYFEMFSGGNWQNTTYGVSFATSNEIEAPDEWEQFSDGGQVLPILRTEPDLIVGPGHNSVVRGPNNRELYCVYHRWTDDGRVLAIDRMDFAGKRIFVVGATHTPQPMTFAPAPNPCDLSASSQGWTIGDLPSSFLCEITFKCRPGKGENADIGFSFATDAESVCLKFDPISNEISLGGVGARKLHPEFDWTAKHQIRIEADHRKLRISLDGADITACPYLLADPVTAITSFSEKNELEISSFQFTEGFEELFEDDLDPRSNGWQITAEATCPVESGDLLVHAASRIDITKHRPLQHCEFAVNFRVTDSDRVGRFGLVLRTERNDVLQLSVDTSDATLAINNEPIHRITDEATLQAYHQLRVIKVGVEAFCYFDDLLIKKIEIDDVECSAHLFCDRASVAIEMIRLTSI